MRIEHDSLGDFPVPDKAWYGIQTARAVANFPISGRRPDADFVRAHVQIKLAAARVHGRVDLLSADLSQAIEQACQRILNGEFIDQFVVDRFQAGAGTSHNMNSNEVIANLANVALDGERGSYSPVHPNDHVNMGQSTNDSIPTAIRLTLLHKRHRLLAAISHMEESLRQLAEQEHDTVKSARTHLQDAVPITLGQEFAGYATALEQCRQHLEHSCLDLCQIGLGGSAAGTGINTAPGYPEQVAAELALITGEPITSAPDLVAKMQSQQDLQWVSASLRGLALELTRICNDMRLLASGPRTGLGEIVLPAVQPGSSIMPGKVNPVMFEMLNQVCFQVLGQDHAVALMTQAGQLELNVMMPAMGSALFDAMEWMSNAMNACTDKNLKDIHADVERCAHFLHQSVGLATLLNQDIGYQAASELAKESAKTGASVRDLVLQRKLLDAETFDAIVLKAAHGISRP